MPFLVKGMHNAMLGCALAVVFFHSFCKQQDSMEDYIELSLMLQYKVIFSIMWKSLSNTATLYIDILAMRNQGTGKGGGGKGRG